MPIENNISLADALYENGEFEQAFKLYESLAEKGDAIVQAKIGRMYDDGLGIAEDLSKAAFWYEQAAKQGHTNSQFNLAGLYLHGEGVTKSLEKAYYWYREVAKNGDEEAKKYLLEIQNACSPEDPSEKPFGYRFLVDNIEFEDLNGAFWQLIPQDTDVIKEDLMRYLNRNWPTESHKAINLALQEDYVAPELSHYLDVLDNDNGYNYLADVYEFLLSKSNT